MQRVLCTAEVDLSPASPGRRAIVYRVEAGRAAFYVRVAEEPGEDLRTDAIVLERARELRASVPEVIAVESDPPELDRSFLLTTVLPGVALAASHGAAGPAAREAGRDLALINSIGIKGHGWLVRDGSTVLRGELARYADFVLSELPDPWPGWLEPIFSVPELEALQRTLWAELEAPLEEAVLAHGDLDVTHVFIDQGRYRGVIDFGEARGGDRYFDLGHFLLHDQETRPDALFDDFLSGYREVTDLPGDHRDRVQRSAILSGLRQLSLWLSPRREGRPTDFLVRFRRAQLLNLLENQPAGARRGRA